MDSFSGVAWASVETPARMANLMGIVLYVYAIIFLEVKMDDKIIRDYVYLKSHQMFTERPELYQHADIIRQYLRLAFIDGMFRQKTEQEGMPPEGHEITLENFQDEKITAP